VAIRRGDESEKQKVDRFTSLLKPEYSHGLSCPASASRKIRHYNKPDVPPTTEDPGKNSFINNEMKKISALLQTKTSYGTWRRLSEVVLTKLIVFNERTASQPAKLEVPQYLERQN
jgi:hypothetical protein